MEAMRASHGVAPGEEWEPLAGLDVPEADMRRFLAGVPFNQWVSRRPSAAAIPVPAAETLAPRRPASTSTQETFGRVLDTIARAGGPLADRIVTTSPDVTVSTNLGGWVNRRRLFHHKAQEDMFSKEQVGSFQRWVVSPKGQHVELGIAEHNLFLMLAAAGMSHSLFGERLIPIGTVYDPFIERGLDALTYALYQDARFILVATPSGITLAPEGGAHQSTTTPLLGMGKPHLSSFEPAFADELLAILGWAFRYVQAHGKDRQRNGGDWRGGAGTAAEPGASDLLADDIGGSVYLRLSTRKVDQPVREIDSALESDILAGAYWMRPPAEGASLAIVYTGAVAPEAMEAHAAVLESNPGAGLLAVTSADRLWRGWGAAQRARRAGSAGSAGAESRVEALLAPLARDARIVTVIDGHPATLGWLGSVRGHRVEPLGVDRFGQSGSLPDLYREHGIGMDAILEACSSCSGRRAGDWPGAMKDRGEIRGDIVSPAANLSEWEALE